MFLTSKIFKVDFSELLHSVSIIFYFVSFVHNFFCSIKNTLSFVFLIIYFRRNKVYFNQKLN